MRKRKIVFIGGMFYIRLSKADTIDFNLKEGNFVNIDDIIKLKESKKK